MLEKGGSVVAGEAFSNSKQTPIHQHSTQKTPTYMLEQPSDRTTGSPMLDK